MTDLSSADPVAELAARLQLSAPSAARRSALLALAVLEHADSGGVVIFRSGEHDAILDVGSLGARRTPGLLA